jgi:hypothetical protein
MKVVFDILVASQVAFWIFLFGPEIVVPEIFLFVLTWYCCTRIEKIFGL